MNDFATRLRNTKNRNQGPWKKVLTVCSAGLLRSPTIAHVLSLPPYNCNTRAAGANPEYALIKLDKVLVEWADAIVCADVDQVLIVQEFVSKCSWPQKPVFCLCLPDSYNTREKALLDRVRTSLNSVVFPGTKEEAITERFNDTGTQ